MIFFCCALFCEAFDLGIFNPIIGGITNLHAVARNECCSIFVPKDSMN
jgi:hypothetical protein